MLWRKSYPGHQAHTAIGVVSDVSCAQDFQRSRTSYTTSRASRKTNALLCEAKVLALLSFARHLTSESKPLSTFYGVCYTVTREPRNGFPVVNARQTWNNPQYEGVDGIVCFTFILVLGLCCYIAYFLRGVPNRWAIQIFWNCFCPFFGHLKLTHPVSIRCGETRGYS